MSSTLNCLTLYSCQSVWKGCTDVDSSYLRTKNIVCWNFIPWRNWGQKPMRRKRRRRNSFWLNPAEVFLSIFAISSYSSRSSRASQYSSLQVSQASWLGKYDFWRKQKRERQQYRNKLGNEDKILLGDQFASTHTKKKSLKTASGLKFHPTQRKGFNKAKQSRKHKSWVLQIPCVSNKKIEDI